MVRSVLPTVLKDCPVWVYGLYMTIHRLLIFFAALISVALPSFAQDIGFLRSDSVTICPAAMSDIEPPDFSKAACERKDFWQVDPQGKTVWLRGMIEVPEKMLQADAPLGLYVSGKIAGKAYLNGQLLGQNGVPGDARASETPGRMDAVFYVPRGAVSKGDNEVVLLMSSHHGILQLRSPLHGVRISAYTEPSNYILTRYWPSLLTFGAFVLGAFYFGVFAVRGMDRFGSSLLALVCLFAGGQLITEAARGLYAYLYPYHDLRLLLITGFSLGFGLCLAAHVIEKFDKQRWRAHLLVIFVVTGLGILVVPGFDGKAIIAMFVPTLGALGVTLFHWRAPHATSYVIVLALFSTATILISSQFLDVVFFYSLLILLVFLMAQQANTLFEERTRRLDEQARAQRLQTALDQAREPKAPVQLKIKHVGKVEMVDTDKITHCNGAGDYVELCFSDGRKILHSGSMNELEALAPSNFLRVHRSHMVNLNYIGSLNREPSGTGALILTTEDTIPVSRRIMPKVRNALA